MVPDQALLLNWINFPLKSGQHFYHVPNNKITDKVFSRQFSLGVRHTLIGHRGQFVECISSASKTLDPSLSSLKMQNKTMASSKVHTGTRDTQTQHRFYCDNYHALPVGMANWKLYSTTAFELYPTWCQQTLRTTCCLCVDLSLNQGWSYQAHSVLAAPSVAPCTRPHSRRRLHCSSDCRWKQTPSLCWLPLWKMNALWNLDHPSIFHQQTLYSFAGIKSSENYWTVQSFK